MALFNRKTLGVASVVVLATALLWPDQKPTPVNDNTPANTPERTQDSKYKSPFKAVSGIETAPNPPLLQIMML